MATVCDHRFTFSCQDLSKDLLVPHHWNIRIKSMSNDGIVMVNFYNFYISCSDTANISQVADHIDYIRQVTGVDHVGIGGDYDGVNRLPKGLEDVSKYPDLISELINRGWIEEDLKKLIGLNLIRVLRKAEQVRDQMAVEGIQPIDDVIPPEYLEGLNNCTYDFS